MIEKGFLFDVPLVLPAPPTANPTRTPVSLIWELVSHPPDTCVVEGRGHLNVKLHLHVPLFRGHGMHRHPLAAQYEHLERFADHPRRLRHHHLPQLGNKFHQENYLLLQSMDKKLDSEACLRR